MFEFSNFLQCALQCIRNFDLKTCWRSVIQHFNLKDKYNYFFSPSESWDTQHACCIYFTSIRLKLTVCSGAAKLDKKFEDVKNPLALPGLYWLIAHQQCPGHRPAWIAVSKRSALTRHCPGQRWTDEKCKCVPDSAESRRQ